MRTKAVLLAGVLLAGSVAVSLGQEFTMIRSTVDGGGGTSAGGLFELSATIGQPDAGAMTGGGFVLQGGFWPGAIPTAVVPGDCDADGDVDLDDYIDIELCLLGPDDDSGPGCECFDLDADNDVDLADFAELQTTLGGV